MHMCEHAYFHVCVYHTGWQLRQQAMNSDFLQSDFSLSICWLCDYRPLFAGSKPVCASYVHLLGLKETNAMKCWLHLAQRSRYYSTAGLPLVAALPHRDPGFKQAT